MPKIYISVKHVHACRHRQNGLTFGRKISENISLGSVKQETLFFCRQQAFIVLSINVCRCKTSGLNNCKNVPLLNKDLD